FEIEMSGTSCLSALQTAPMVSAWACRGTSAGGDTCSPVTASSDTATSSARLRSYDGFSRAPAASAGTRRAHTCHQHARARQAPAETAVAAASDPPYLHSRAL